jgi:NadR type nicotinamide-nucleotide adenylyltransferase
VTRFRHGLMIGKCCPPHAGHMLVIEHAAARCEQVTVVIGGRRDEPIALADRVDWLAWECARLANVTVVGAVDEHRNDFADPALWDTHVVVIRAAVEEVARGVALDAVFSGEDYGDELARRLGAVHVRRPRDPDGPSSTRLRADPAAHWQDLIAPARVGLARRIAVVGAESTGTSTLSRALATALDAGWVGEYGRYRSYALLAGERMRAHAAGEPAARPEDIRWHSDEFTAIAARQTAAIDEACLAHPIVIADTDALATSLWHERYVGGPHHPALVLARAQPPALYLLTSPGGVAWEHDGLRDGEAIRAGMHEAFVRELERCGSQWQLVEGTPAQRLAAALAACQVACRW